MAEEIASMFIKVSGQVDEAIKSLDAINEKLGNVEQSTTKTAEAAESSFQQLAHSTIDVTATFIQLEHTFSSIENLQLRLENANERLANAQDRLADAQKNVKRATDAAKSAINIYGKNSREAQQATDKLSDANQELVRAQRGVTISENNLTRAHAQVLGVGLQVVASLVTMASNYGKVMTSVRLFTTAIVASSEALLATPIGLAAIGVALIAGGIALDKYKAKQDAMKESLEETSVVATEAFDGLDAKVGIVSDKIDGIRNRLAILQGIKDPRELADRKRLVEIEHELAQAVGEVDAKLRAGDRTLTDQFMSVDGVREHFLRLQPEVRDLWTEYNALENKITKVWDNQNKQMDATVAEIENNLKILEAQNAGFAINTNDLTSSLLTEMNKLNDQVILLIQNFGELQAQAERAAAAARSIKVTTSTAPPNLLLDMVNKNKTQTTKTPAPKVVKKNDFIVTKSGQIIEPSAKDTLMGFKGDMPGGTKQTNVYVTVQGSLIAENELITKVSRSLNQTLYARTPGSV